MQRARARVEREQAEAEAARRAEEAAKEKARRDADFSLEALAVVRACLPPDVRVVLLFCWCAFAGCDDCLVGWLSVVVGVFRVC